MKKKREKLGELVTLEVTFLCPNSHEIKVAFPHFQSPNAHRVLETIPFSVQCPLCKWEGVLKWNRHISVRVVEPNHEIH
jgi:hypothetical protein